MLTVLVTAGIYGSRSHLTNQPQEGPIRKFQGQIIQTVQETRQPVITSSRVHGPRQTLDKFKKNYTALIYKILKPLYTE